MGLFRRKANDDELLADDELDEADGSEELDGELGDGDGDGADEADDTDAGAGAAVEDTPRVAPPRPQGPWDSDDLPADDDRERVDLGGLRIFVPEDVELRVDLDQNQQIVAATMVHDEELMQLGVYAAPRTEPIWDEVREEIAGSIREGGGSYVEVEGSFGAELRARVPTDQPGVLAPARFLGVNGPRWFLRALLTGPRSAEGQDDPKLLEALRGVVVHRGPDAMAPRDGLALRLPKEAQAGAEAAIAAAQADSAADSTADGDAAGAEAAGGERPLLSLPERGPEITETR